MLFNEEFLSVACGRSESMKSQELKFAFNFNDYLIYVSQDFA